MSKQKVKEAVDALSAANDEKARDQLRIVSECYQKWHEAQERKKQVASSCRERLEAARAGVRGAIERPLRTGASKADVQSKVMAIELAWQELEEERAHVIELKKESAEDVKVAKTQLDRSIRESRQLAFPFAGALQMKNDEPEEDEPEEDEED